MNLRRDTGPSPSSPLQTWGPLRRFMRLASRPLERFLRIEAASGLLLLFATGVALAWANSPWAESYVRAWQTPLGFSGASWTLERTLAWVVNDGLMVIFFFVVGMEIRREIHHGELSEWRRAALPAAAALGGMLAPAGLYLLLANKPEIRAGWGVPMATDIAFAVGILALLGKRVPAALRVLLLALAVIDDLGAILVIALFYSSGLAPVGLLVGVAGLGGVFLMQRLGVRAKWAYVSPALVTWGGLYAAGIHPTIAGVLVGLITPVRESGRLIETLHPWVAFGIMPLFALANAGVPIVTEFAHTLAPTVIAGIVTGLVVGKPLGILIACWLSVRLGVALLPVGLTLKHLIVLGFVAGVGFTMSLFVAQLAFVNAELLAAAKLAVLTASLVAAVLGLSLGRALLPTRIIAGAEPAAEDAERSSVQ